MGEVFEGVIELVPVGVVRRAVGEGRLESGEPGRGAGEGLGGAGRVGGFGAGGDGEGGGEFGSDLVGREHVQGVARTGGEVEGAGDDALEGKFADAGAAVGADEDVEGAGEVGGGVGVEPAEGGGGELEEGEVVVGGKGGEGGEEGGALAGGGGVGVAGNQVEEPGEFGRVVGVGQAEGEAERGDLGGVAGGGAELVGEGGEELAFGADDGGGDLAEGADEFGGVDAGAAGGEGGGRGLVGRGGGGAGGRGWRGRGGQESAVPSGVDGADALVQRRVGGEGVGEAGRKILGEAEVADFVGAGVV